MVTSTTYISKYKFIYYWKTYLLIVIPLSFVLLFCYYPIVNGFIHIFYNWDGDTVEEFTGLQNIYKLIHDYQLWRSFLVVTVFILANFVQMIPPIIAAVILHHVNNKKMQYIYRICFVIPMVIPTIVGIFIWKYYYEPNAGFFNELLRSVGLISSTQTIKWLTDENLVIPSLLFVGFPWIGAFGVLIYLVGLQNISPEVYEAADIDGARPLTIFWKIELPLIMTQIRINLVLTMISTIQGWQTVYLFLGEGGGPNGIATVPGLYIFREAFSRGHFGYGCAIGFLLFLITLILTWFSNRYVKVDK